MKKRPYCVASVVLDEELGGAVEYYRQLLVARDRGTKLSLAAAIRALLRDALRGSPKKISCRVVSNYGRHIPGEVITVDEKEYFRLREPVVGDDGDCIAWTCPVLREADEADASES